MSNVNKQIKDFYCNGFFGRRYDLADSIIEAEGKDWIVVRLEEHNSDGELVKLAAFAEFRNEEQKDYYINCWTNSNEDCSC